MTNDLDHLHPRVWTTGLLLHDYFDTNRARNVFGLLLQKLRQNHGQNSGNSVILHYTELYLWLYEVYELALSA